MNKMRFVPLFAMFCALCVTASFAQTEKPTTRATAAPKILLLVHQQFKFGSEGARQKLEASVARACDHLEVPNSWIDLQSVTGAPEALSFDPFDSFEQVDNAGAAWPQIFAAHPALARGKRKSELWKPAKLRS